MGGHRPWHRSRPRLCAVDRIGVSMPVRSTSDASGASPLMMNVQSGRDREGRGRQRLRVLIDHGALRHDGGRVAVVLVVAVVGRGVRRVQHHWRAVGPDEVRVAGQVVRAIIGDDDALAGRDGVALTRRARGAVGRVDIDVRLALLQRLARVRVERATRAFRRPGRAGWAAAGGWASETEGCTWTCGSGMICATAGLASRGPLPRPTASLPPRWARAPAPGSSRRRP